MLAIKRISSGALYLACALLLGLALCSELRPDYHVAYGGKLLFAVLASVLLLSASLIRISYLTDENKKAKTMRACLWTIFAVHSIYLVLLLFVSDRGMQNPFHIARADYRLYLRMSVNLVPFKSVIAYGRSLLRGELRYSIVNIFGNLFAFAPMGFFLPVLFKKMRSPLKFTLLVTLIVICVELLQIATLAGACDIDDVILNTLGAVLVFLLVQTKPLQKTLKRRHIV